MKIQNTTFFWTLLFVGQIAIAQKLPEKGVPPLTNYTPVQYNNSGKIWDIKSSSWGIVYMASDKGLLAFDGKNWNAFKGSKSFTRSLLVLNDSAIYTGSDLDFGVWRRNKFHGFEYTSLYPFQNDIRDISEEFWDVHQQDDKIIFVSTQNIYLYKKDQQLTKIAAPFRFSGSFSVSENLYFADEKEGLFIFSGLNILPVFRYPSGVDFQITGMYAAQQGLYIVTRSAGLYLFSSGVLKPVNNNLSQQLKRTKVFSFELIDSTYLAFGTVLNGLYIANVEGTLIHLINKNKGLLNNTILSLHHSPAGKLWVGMDYGVSALDLHSSLTYFYDYRGDFGSGYTALLKDEIFYLGTNQGLYHAKWTDLNNDKEFVGFQLIPGTEGQVWALENVENTLLIGHDQGLMRADGNTVTRIAGAKGVWNVVPYGDYLLTGNYNGISVFRKSGSGWIFDRKMELILGSCNQVIVENDNILWVNIPNYGIIRASLNEDLFPGDRIIFLEDNFEGQDITLIQRDSQIEVLTDRFRYAFIDPEKGFMKTGERERNSRLDNQLSGIFLPVSLGEGYAFYPLYNGFALNYRDSRIISLPENISIIFPRIIAFNNREKVSIYADTLVPFRLNNMRIEFIVPNQDGTLYQYRLDDMDQWSEWSQENTIDLVNLSHGKHTLFVRANIRGNIMKEAAVSFSIKAPWYLTWLAFLVYGILLMGIVGGIAAWQRLLLRKQKRMLKEKEREALYKQAEAHKQTELLWEQERLMMEHNQLKQQLRNKTIELANKAKDNEDKNRLLLALKEKCEVAQKDPATSNRRWNEIQRMLDTYLKLEDNTFEIQMDELYQEFYRKLKDKFPNLSTHDLRLSAYLKIGLNSKEIADLLNIQPSSAYISRSRLRKKLNLSADEDLHDFLNGI